jgi:hypothetical protein
MMWNRPDVDFIQSQDVAWQAVGDGDFGATGGGRKRLLSRDAGSGAETSLVQVRDRQLGSLGSDIDLFVVGGKGTLNGKPLLQGDYAYVPAGTSIDVQPSVRGLTVYAGSWGAPTLDAGVANGSPATEVVHLHPEDERWVPAGWSGDVELQPGAMVKRLRQDDGANIYLAAMMPGWRCDDEESHPVYEESFKVYGDVLMGARGVMWDGAYFFRSPDVFHGPLYSRTGTMSFIRSNGPTTTTYRTPGPGGSWKELASDAYRD